MEACAGETVFRFSGQRRKNDGFMGRLVHTGMLDCGQCDALRALLLADVQLQLRYDLHWNALTA
jgi:hypothetical protein